MKASTFTLIGLLTGVMTGMLWIAGMMGTDEETNNLINTIHNRIQK